MEMSFNLKSLSRGLCALFAGVVLSATSLSAAVETGQKAPDFTLTSIEGTKHSLSEFAGKVVVLEWVNPECPFVKHHYQGTGNLPALQRQAKADGVVWLLINSGKPGAQGDFDAAKVKAWQAEVGAAPAAYFRDQDGTVGRLYGAKTTPHMYVISKEGVLVYQGAIDSVRGFDAAATKAAVNYVTAALTSLREGKPVEVGSKPAYGCSVKY